MNTSELINELQKSLKENGDLEVFIPGFDGENVTTQYPDLVEDIYVSTATKYQLKSNYPTKYIQLI